MPTVTVISTNFNHGRFLKDTVESVLNQTYPDIQYIVADGGSTDESLSILKKYPTVEVISEPDEGPFDALQKGIRKARGKYVMYCAVSDGYLDTQWVEKCVKVMESDPEVSLVWGLPRYMDEHGALRDVSFPQFYKKDPPQKQDFIYYWLSSFFHFPEGNYCIRKSVFEDCFRAYVPGEAKNGFSESDRWLELSYRFNAKGYLPYFIRDIANFGRMHEDQRGKHEVATGLAYTITRSYFTLCKKYRSDLLSERAIHRFRDGKGNVLPYHFSCKRLVRELLSVHAIMNQAKPAVRPFFNKIKSLPGVKAFVNYLKKSL